MLGRWAEPNNWWNDLDECTANYAVDCAAGYIVEFAPGAPIPTVSTWGMVAMTGLLLAAGSVLLRDRFARR